MTQKMSSFIDYAYHLFEKWYTPLGATQLAYRTFAILGCCQNVQRRTQSLLGKIFISRKNFIPDYITRLFQVRCVGDQSSPFLFRFTVPDFLSKFFGDYSSPFSLRKTAPDFFEQVLENAAISLRPFSKTISTSSFRKRIWRRLGHRAHDFTVAQCETCEKNHTKTKKLPPIKINMTTTSFCGS